MIGHPQLSEWEKAGQLEIRRAIHSVRGESQITIRDLPPKQYIVERKFLCDRCGYEVRHCFVIRLDWACKDLKICFFCARELLRQNINGCSDVQVRRASFSGRWPPVPPGRGAAGTNPKVLSDISSWAASGVTPRHGSPH